MKILIVGAGLSGCSLARILKDRGHDVAMIEKEGHIGGLCITSIDKNGLKYEPFGARTFHTKKEKIKDFVLRFDGFNGYVHRKGMIINNELFHFPITVGSISRFQEKDRIMDELNKRPEQIDATNFETACISIFGKTLYGYFIENYSKKMWDVEPKDLTSEWAPKRLNFAKDEEESLFNGQWQGLPKNGYSYLLEEMIKDIKIEFNTRSFDEEDFDVVVSSALIDKTMDFSLGDLGYRSLKFDYAYDEDWEKDNYGTINLPQAERYIRKCNFKILHKQGSKHSIIQYQEPVKANNNGNVPMYPINSEENNKLFEKYLKKICERRNVCPIGRLGLFKYLDMDKAVEVAFDMAPLIEEYPRLSNNDRYEKIMGIRDRY